MDMIINNYPIYKLNTQPIKQANVSFKSLNNIEPRDEFVKNSHYAGYLNYQLEQTSMPVLFDGYRINESVQKPFYQKALEEAVPSLRKKYFTQEDYQKLTKKEKNILRNIILQNDKHFHIEFADKNIKSDTKYILNIAERIKNNLNGKYPNGYKLVSIGNSASPFVSAMNTLGEDTLTLPFSKQTFMKAGGFPYKNTKGIPYTPQDWENYFKFHGIDKNFEKRTGKKLIFTDYVYTGQSLKLFSGILEKLGFDPKTEIIDFPKLINSSKPKEINKLKNSLMSIDFKYLSEKMSAKLCNEQNIDIIRNPEYIENQGERFVSKLFKFALFEQLEKNKLPFFEELKEYKLPLLKRMLRKLF